MSSDAIKNVIAYAMADVYRKERNLGAAVAKVQEMHPTFARSDSMIACMDCMWRAIDAYEDTRDDE